MESRYRKSPLELSFQDILADVPVAERLVLATHNPIKAQRATYKTYKFFFFKQNLSSTGFVLTKVLMLILLLGEKSGMFK